MEYIIHEKWHLHFIVGTASLLLGIRFNLLTLSFICLVVIELVKEYLDTLNMGRFCADRSIPDGKRYGEVIRIEFYGFKSSKTHTRFTIKLFKKK